MQTIQETCYTRDSAFFRAMQLYEKDSTVVVIESAREPGKWFIENGAPMVRNFERIIWSGGKAI